METLKFKTNIACMGCVKAISTVLNNTEEIDSWTVDLTTPEKILTVASKSIEPELIEGIIEKAGFKAEQVTNTR